MLATNKLSGFHKIIPKNPYVLEITRAYGCHWFVILFSEIMFLHVFCGATGASTTLCDARARFYLCFALRSSRLVAIYIHRTSHVYCEPTKSTFQDVKRGIQQHYSSSINEARIKRKKIMSQHNKTALVRI